MNTPNLTSCNNNLRIALRILLVALVFGCTSPVLAADSITREQAISAALERTDPAAKVLSVKKITQNSDAPYFAVKLMVNGRVKVVRIPAER